MGRILKYLVIAVVLFLIVAQFIRPDLSNPPVNQSATFEAVAAPASAMSSILKRACYDCHTNTTVWPWYSHVAPASWLVAEDVKDGRSRLNFSEWGNLGLEMAQKRLKAVCEEAQAGEMPLWQYRLMHPEAKLSEEDIKVLCGPAAPVKSMGVTQ